VIVKNNLIFGVENYETILNLSKACHDNILIINLFIKICSVFSMAEHCVCSHGNRGMHHDMIHSLRCDKIILIYGILIYHTKHILVRSG